MNSQPIRAFPLLLILLAALAIPAASQPAAPSAAEPYPLDRLNAGLEEPEVPLTLSTPKAALESFMTSMEHGDESRAAWTMNLNEIENGKQQLKGLSLARKLHELLQEDITIKWEQIPDSPEGTRTGEVERENSSTSNSYLVGQLPGEDGGIEIVLQRVRLPDRSAFWVFSSQTVDELDEYFQENRSGFVDNFIGITGSAGGARQMESWQWGALVLALVLCLIIGRLVQFLIAKTIRHFAPEKIARFVRPARWPVAILVAVAFFYFIALPWIGMPNSVNSIADVFVVSAIIFAVTWLIIAILSVVFSIAYETYGKRLEENDERRGRFFNTQIVVLRRVSIFVVIFIGTCFFLSQFEFFGAMGTYLLASAGVMGIVIGLAAQRTLGNIFAGMQVGMAQPVSIGDVVIFEGQWGTVEEICFTYIVISTWDKRRLVVPIHYFLDHPVENWSRTSSKMWGPVYIYADYRVDIDAVREKAKQFIQDSEYYNGDDEPQLLVTACKDDVVELRAVGSADSSSQAWYLKCEVREKLVKFLQEFEGGRYLPRTRIELHRDPRFEEAREKGDSHGEERNGRGSKDAEFAESGAGGNEGEEGGQK